MDSVSDNLYQPLADGSIRLLSFLDDTGYACQMQPFPLGSAPPYIALSYTWGPASYQKGRDANLQYSIKLNSTDFITQQNLHDALGHLGGKVRMLKCLFWVDAICINQTDLAERASQVRQMTTIYEKAERTFAWLGVPFDDNETRLAVNLMREFHVHLREGLERNNDDIDIVLASITSDHDGFPVIHDTPAWKAWDGIAEMFNQPYFHRVWIYQEATTPGLIDFYCGEHSFDEIFLSATIAFAYTFSNFSGFNVRFIEAAGYGSSVGSISAARDARQKGKKNSLLELMTQVRKAKCTDPKDKVYATLGLAKGMPDGRIDIDYRTKSTNELFIDVARYAISESGLGLETLGLVFTAFEEAENRYLSEMFKSSVPSWVPDWRQRISISRITSSMTLSQTGRTLYDACPGSVVEARFLGREIELIGYIAEHMRIKLMTSVCDQPGASWDTPRAWHDSLLASPHAADELEKKIDRSIVGDRQVAIRGVSSNGFSRIYRRGGAVDWKLIAKEREGLDLASLNLRDDMSTIMSEMCVGRRMILFSDGGVGILPAATVMTDKVAAFHGGESLYVVRSVPDRVNTYSFVGECYVDGCMDGQLVDFLREINWPCQSIRLV